MKDPNLKITGTRVYLRYVGDDDFEELTGLFKKNAEFFKGRLDPPLTNKKFKLYVERNLSDANACFVICLKNDDSIIGVLNFSQIFRGAFQNSSIGYALSENFTGNGYMTETIEIALSYAFIFMKLHRLEANIQPENLASIAVVERCGFLKEGYSPKYLKIDEKWCDHERWAIIEEDWKQRQG